MQAAYLRLDAEEAKPERWSPIFLGTSRAEKGTAEETSKAAKDTGKGRG